MGTPKELGWRLQTRSEKVVRFFWADQSGSSYRQASGSPRPRSRPSLSRNGVSGLLAIGGAAIFPLTQAILRAAGRQASLSAQNPLGHLAMQVAFTVPIMVPVAAAAALAKPGWFYPACLVIVGAHYLPFVFLYGMKTYAFLAGSLIAAGYLIGLYAPQQIVAGGWAGAGILCVFACVLATVYRATASRSA
jgi:hypothetical protein